MTEAIFVPDGDSFIPTEHAAGPWDPGALHGGAPAALMARAIEAVEPELGMFVSRLTAEFMRPVPMAPLRLATEVIRPGKKVQLVQASLTAGGTLVATATALRIRQAPIEVAAGEEEPAPPPPEQATRLTDVPWPGFGGAMNPLLAAGSVVDPGPATVWFNLRMPVVAGEPPSPLMRAVAAADFGNGISRVLDFRRHIFINPDLTVYLSRSPRGEWIALDSQTFTNGNGIGLAQSRIFDRDGRVGSSLQALLLDSRTP
ncbi:MAG TPA: thioesterase family protein [Candidatus Solibacter sp.]|jgi:acyl-CoA thioesterase|nr:thioesterase family protein [Candidatus Solibacter sp.]